ncbi:hypothetical protein BU26DRAFT_524955 [Trematosphaeria pertusa]|uniref:Aminoglycoside phosphotransferase domain-containing protein n=1 Tax=Trematosphaeria pertusa TaxID=390896 RepID=A0A6A6HUX3_9PLEO|nr:uncharacterized protein BU26DRAFT_524955 [Trematosphaeria pertusa]KAF2241811.1 hypothetical protein BU26DRAFT_524955 [Trematosphaeria pertusa]
MAFGAADFEVEQSDFVRHELTPTTFKKTSLNPKWKVDFFGNSYLPSRPFNRERIRNEINALQLISSHTSIPVPRLLDWGENPDGSIFLQTERVHGIKLSEVGNTCRMPSGLKHNKGGYCGDCMATAKSNAAAFIQDVVLPELSKLRSNTMGLQGIVIPPAFLLERDKRTRWEAKTADSQKYVFVFGDLVLHNIMMDPVTLKLICIFDLEHSGYFTPECQRWFLDVETYRSAYDDYGGLDELIGSIDA